MKASPILPTLLILSSLAGAKDFHLTPNGAGKRDGSTWENAFDQRGLGNAVNQTIQPGDRLLVGSGVYRDATLVISTGGAPERPKAIVGVDRGEGLPIFASDWSIKNPTKGRTALHLEAGASHVIVEGLRIKGYVFGVHAPAIKGGPSRVHWEFKDVDIEQCRHGFYLADCDDLRLEGCDLKRYSKHGFRFDQGCDRVTARHCTADCSEGDRAWEERTELFPFGFFVNDDGAPNTAFVFEDCLARNNLMPLQTTQYKNGDGFVVEGNSSDVTFVRCRAIRNQDGGFDLKVRDVRLTGCVALHNSRNFRIWTTATLTHCLAAWGTTGLWCNGGPVTVDRGTFHELQSEAVLTDNDATEPVTLNGCLISKTGKAYHAKARGEVVLKATVITAADATSEPKYVRPDPAWNGLGDAMNSRAFPDRGYQSEPGKRE